jgi:hypothetical protein
MNKPGKQSVNSGQPIQRLSNARALPSGKAFFFAGTTILAWRN